MPSFDRFIDPKTKRRLFYQPDKRLLLTEDGAVCYPVINGIPRFVSPKFYEEEPVLSTDEVQTGRSFGEKWCEPRSQSLGSRDFDRRSLEEQFLSILGCASMKELEVLFENAKLTLNAGCGVAWSEYLFDLNPKAERHCVDIGLSVEIARTKTADMPNVTVSQASILELPYPDERFDIVYSCGVIHHTADARRALLEIGRKVSRDGILGIYIYNKKPFVRELCDREIRKLTTGMSYEKCMGFSRKMTMLGKALSRVSQEFVVEEDIDILGIKAGKYHLQRFVYDHIIKCY